MTDQPMKLMLVSPQNEDSPLYSMLKGDGEFDILCASDGKDAAKKLAKEHVEAVVIDMNDEGNESMDAVSRSYSLPPQPPVLVRLDRNASRTTIQEVTAYLIRGEVDPVITGRAVQYAIGRTRVLEETHSHALLDKATGLYNKFAFEALTGQMLKLTRRSNRGALLYISRIENYAQLSAGKNTAWEESFAKKIAALMRSTFRESDVIARVDRNEYMVLAMEITADDTTVITRRLKLAIDRFNVENPDSPITLNSGKSYCDPMDVINLPQMITFARRAMT